MTKQKHGPLTDLPLANKVLAEHVATLLACPDATHASFMNWVDDELRARGYRFSAEQEGIRGTVLRVTTCK